MLEKGGAERGLSLEEAVSCCKLKEIAQSQLKSIVSPTEVAAVKWKGKTTEREKGISQTGATKKNGVKGVERAPTNRRKGVLLLTQTVERAEEEDIGQRCASRKVARLNLCNTQGLTQGNS